MKRPIRMQAPGVIQGRFRPQRVPSSTTPSRASQEGAIIGNDEVEIDFASHPRSLSGEEVFMLYQALDNGPTPGDATYYV